MPTTPDLHSAALAAFHTPVQRWFTASFAGPTPAQIEGWPKIAAGRSTLLLAPTGSGKTLAAFLVAIDRLMFSPEPAKRERCRVLYVSPLKALGADVEKNLRAPIAGIAAVAERDGVPFRVPTIAVRSGDTPARERAALQRTPPDILITTPESLYLLLTSNARAILASVDTIIVDEIHAVVATKRGAHLFLSIERLEALRPRGAASLQRIGLSATQRPLDEVARLLGGGEISGGGDGVFRPRPVDIVDAAVGKAWDLHVEVPAEDMARLAEGALTRDTHSIWPSIYPRLCELIRAHRSTMIFANSRRIAERLAAAVNEAAGAEIALAHHGSVARERRVEIEERLKKGELPAIVATSSLELGLDIGAVDLVIQIEAPPSIASGLQRIGRAGHAVGAVSRGVIFPKYRGDLLSSAAATARMTLAAVEETFYPKNPLDVLAQQIVAIAAMDEVEVDALYALVRRAAPFADLPRGSFEGVLDMLSGRYPSDEFAELRPRITWDRDQGRVRAREGARRVAVVNGGTIPDRGLYGVYLVDGEGVAEGTAKAAPRPTSKSRRVGELDEEMVFESRVGDVFLLGASSWRITEITHDRVLVRPAPGEPGKMPFWHGDRPGRPLEFGRAIGALARTLAATPPDEAAALLRASHGLDERAAGNLVRYLRAQIEATGEVPSDRAIVVERTIDEVGDHRVCVLSPFGARVHAPWCTAIQGLFRDDLDQEIEGLWSDDGMVFRLPGGGDPPAIEHFLPAPDAIEDAVIRSLGESSLFAARFRENAGRALLLPRRHPGQRSPLWATRKKAADLLAVAARYGSFPLILETYRECLRDAFDLAGLTEILRQIKAGEIHVKAVDSRAPSPFAASLLFSYVSNFIYEVDAPLAERRAQALAVDPIKLKELLGEAKLRDLLDAEAIAAIAEGLQRLDGKRPVAHDDGLHDLLLSLGDLSEPEIRARCEPGADVGGMIDRLLRARRIFPAVIAGDRRYAAAEDAARLRDALGVAVPADLPAALLQPVADPLGDVVSRYVRTHGPFTIEALAARFCIGVAPARAALSRLAEKGRVFEGEITPGAAGREWCDAEVLQKLKRRSIAKLRKEVEPVPAEVLGRFLVEWQGLVRPRAGADALIAAIEQLEGAPIPASTLFTDILPARITRFHPVDLDQLCASGEVTWAGIEPLGANDGRIALYLTADVPLLAPLPRLAEGELCARLRAIFERRGALFFSDLLTETSAFTGDVMKALWDLVWAGEVTNDTLAPLRSFVAGADAERASKRRAARGLHVHGRRPGPPGSEGRWSLLARARPKTPSETERRAALARALLERHGVLTREAVAAEGIAGGFSAVYEVLKAMEDAGRVRRGYFVADLGATQFALPGADDRLRGLRDPREEPRALVIAATDPANPYGATLPWPEGSGGDGARPQRAAGAYVVLHGGALIGYLGRAERDVLTFLPGEGAAREKAARALAGALASLVDEGRRRTLLIGRVDGGDPAVSPLAAALAAVGFTSTSKGYFKRVGGRRGDG